MTFLSFIDTNLEDHLTPEQWLAFGKALAVSQVSTLNLSNNKLGLTLGGQGRRNSPAQWKAISKALAISHVTTLKLSDNSLYRLPPEQWLVLGKALADLKVTSLDLTHNSLGCLQYKGQVGIPPYWLAFCDVLARLHLFPVLELGDNKLDKLTPDMWKVFGCALASTKVTTLDLRNNLLRDLKSEQWKAFGDALALSPHVTTLNLGGNMLHCPSRECWIGFTKALAASHVTTLLDVDEVDGRPDIKRILKQNFKQNLRRKH